MTDAVAAPAPPIAGSPYVGLTPFKVTQSGLFFGREVETGVIIGNLRASRLTLLFAESGVGKSSLLRAGVTAELGRHAERDLARRGKPRLVPVIFSAWNQDPVAGLIEAIGTAIEPYTAHGALLSLSHDSLPTALQAATEAAKAPLLIVLDQFEEYFLYRAKQARRDAFADELAECINRPDLNANFLISLREDAHARLGDLFRGRLSNVYANSLRLEYLAAEGAREAIREPIRSFNAQHGTSYDIEEDLVDAVIDGVRLEQSPDEDVHRLEDPRGGNDDTRLVETTYLQLVMKRMWDADVRERTSEVLRLETLESLGGVKTIIAGHLDHAMTRLSREAQDASALVFTFLVTRAGTKVALTVKDLSDLTGLSEARLEVVLRRLAATDVHVLRPAGRADSPDQAAYEISHDALARPIVEWRTQHRVRQEEAQQRELAAQLERERVEKEEAKAQAAQAKRQEMRERTRRRMAVGGLGIVVGIILVAAVAIILQRASQAQLTDTSSSNAIAARLEVLSGSPTMGPNVRALGALEAFRLSPTPNARNELLATLQENVAMPKTLPGSSSRPLSALAMSEDRQGLIAAGSWDGSIRLWDRNGRQLGRPLLASRGVTVSGVAFTPSGDLLAAALANGAVKLWRVSGSHVEARPVRTLPNDDAGLGFDDFRGHPLALSRNGQTLAFVDSNGTVRLWHLPQHAAQRARALRPIRTPHESNIRGLAFNPDGTGLAVAGDRGVTVWDLSSRSHAPPSAGRRLEDGNATSYAVAWAADGQLAAGTDDQVLLWSRPDRAPKALATADQVYSVAFARGGALLASGGQDQAVTVWDTASKRQVGPARQHSETVNAIAVRGDTIVSGDYLGFAKLWSLSEARALAATLGTPVDDQIAIGVGDDGRVATASSWGPIHLWRRVGEKSGAGSSHETLIDDGAAPLAYRGGLVAATVGDAPSAFALWDTRSPCTRGSVDKCKLGRATADGLITALAIDSKRRIIATGTREGSLAFWDISNPRVIRYLGRAAESIGHVNVIAFDSVEPSVVATASDDGRVRLWSLADLRNTRTVKRLGKPLADHAPFSVKALAFSPTQHMLAAGGEDNRITLWDMTDLRHPKLQGEPLPQSDSILSLAFSPNGRTLAAGDGDGSACLYDLDALSFLGSPRCLIGAFSFGDRNAMNAVAFDPKGRSLLTTGAAEPVVAWDSTLWAADEKALSVAACRLAGRNLTAEEWNAVFFRTKLAGRRHKTCAQYPLP
jgi:WD40 repeat protein